MLIVLAAAAVYKPGLHKHFQPIAMVTRVYCDISHKKIFAALPLVVLRGLEFKPKPSSRMKTFHADFAR